MTVEPCNVVFAFGAKAPTHKHDEPRTLADYQAPIIARFGRLPSWPELARLERGLTIAHRPYVPPPPNPMTIAARAAIVAKGEATRNSIMTVLTRPMTSADLSRALGRTQRLLNHHLNLLADQGKITGHKVKGVTVWEAKV